MFEQQHILKKIEQWADRLPSSAPLDFSPPPKRERMVIEYAFVY